MADCNHLKSLLKSGQTTRREFLAESAALAAAGVVVPALVGGGARAATPKRGGRLRMGITDAAVSDALDPALSITIMQAVLTHGVLQNNLVEIDHEGNTEAHPHWAAAVTPRFAIDSRGKGCEPPRPAPLPPA